MEPVVFDTVVVLTVAVCAVLSYGLGAKAILDGRYQPSVYSRGIWMLFAFNNLVSVLVLQNSAPVLILAGLGGFGNLVIFVLSLSRSVRRCRDRFVASEALRS